MAQIIVSPQAEQDLAQLIDEITSKAGLAIADRLVDRIVAIVGKLAVVPKASGRPIPNLGVDIRCHPIGSYNVYLRYAETADTLYVLRVLHGRRNITAALFHK